MADNLNERLEQSSHGPLQTKPDERHRFLGSLRERVYLKMTIKDLGDPANLEIFLKHINDYKVYQILINGKMPQNETIDQIEAACAKENIPFTLVSDESAQTNLDSAAILVVAKSAINKERIELKQVYPPEFPKEELATPKKEVFWHKLFHRGDVE